MKAPFGHLPMQGKGRGLKLQYFLRFYLCMMVVGSHFWSSASATSEGAFAVMGFYVISGYVITMALSSHYLQQKGGFKRFWINRFLRLYPTYFCCALLGFVAISVFPEIAQEVSARMVRPETEAGAAALAAKGISPSLWPLFYIQQIVLIGQITPLIYHSPIGFAPTSWSVNMELYYYLILSLGASATVAYARKFLIIGSAFVAIYFILLSLHQTNSITMDWGRPLLSTTPHSVFAKSFLGITVFFGLGAFIYYLKKLDVQAAIRWPFTLIILIIPYIYVAGITALIIQYLIFGLGVAMVIRMWPDERPQGFLRFLGDMSFPLFLVHWPIAVLVSALSGLSKNSPEFLLLAGSASLVASAALVILLERPIEYFRNKVRSGKIRPA